MALTIEWININKATEMKRLEQELALVEAHIAANEEKIKKIGKEVENYEEEYDEQEVLQERVPADSQEELIG